jgi:hypothetical protein
MTSLSAASFLLAILLDLKCCRQITILTFIAALGILDVLYATDLKFPSPSF